MLLTCLGGSPGICVISKYGTRKFSRKVQVVKRGPFPGKYEEKWNLVTNEIGPELFHYLIGYISENVKGDTVYGTIISIPRVDIWISNCVKRHIVKEYRGGRRKKEFDKRFSTYAKVATEKGLEK